MAEYLSAAQLREHYQIVYSQIAKSRMLDDIASSMLGIKVHFKKPSDDLGDLVLQ